MHVDAEEIFLSSFALDYLSFSPWKPGFSAPKKTGLFLVINNVYTVFSHAVQTVFKQHLIYCMN